MQNNAAIPFKLSQKRACAKLKNSCAGNRKYKKEKQ